MPVRVIEPLSGDGDGLEFGEFWGDPGLVGAALAQLALHLQPSVCYCLAFKEQGPKSCFAPYGTNGLCTDAGVAIPPTVEVPYRRLLIEQPGDWKWPILGQWVSGPYDSAHPPQLATAVWHGLVRAKKKNDYVGFLKASFLEGPPPNDLTVRDAYRQTKIWLDSKVFALRHNGQWNTEKARSDLATSIEYVKGDLGAGRLKSAVQRVASVITSNLGADFNRAACFVKVHTEDALTCLYAHGGPCTNEWSREVQLPFASEVRTISQLQERLQIPPEGDPLYRDLSRDRPLTLNIIERPASLLAQIWNLGGSLEQVAKESAVADGPPMPEIMPDGTYPPAYNIGARLDLTDSAMTEWRRARPESPLFGCRNGNFFALSWSLDGKLLAIWLLDLGYWPQISLVSDIVPRLRSAKGLLAEFAPLFRGSELDR